MLTYVRFAASGLKKRKLRSILTVTAVVIGIFAIVALTSLGQSLQKTITQEFEEMGSDKIFITPGGAFFGMLGSTSELLENDMKIIKNVPGVEEAAGILFKIDTVKFKDDKDTTWVMGLPTDESRKVAESMQNFQIAAGRNLKNGDKYKAVVGYLIGEGKFFDKEVNIGDTLTVRNKQFDVVGIMEKIGNSQDDSSIIVPLDTTREIFDEPDKYDAIFAQVDKTHDPTDVAEEIKKKLRKDRGLEKGEEDFGVETSEKLQETYQGIIDIVIIVVLGIAAISLLVGGIGIMNTMYTNILERTREIGIMKAIGAKTTDITAIFLIEAGILGLIGGIIGVIFGAGLITLIGYVLSTNDLLAIDIHVSLELLIGAILFSFVLGALSGALPAKRAAKLNPVDALRYE